MRKISNYFSKKKFLRIKRASACYIAKSLKKGLTLIELTVAMSIGSILILGIGTLIITTNNNINTVKADSDRLLNAKSLSLSLESNIDEHQKNISYVTNSIAIDQDFAKEIKDEDILNSPIIFKATNDQDNKNYIFVNQVFGYYQINEDNSVLFTRVYTCTYRVKLEINKDASSDKVVFTIDYDDNSKLNIKLVKFVKVAGV